MYIQLRHDLEKIFMWRQCSDPEGLTDEVFDRVSKKVHDVRTTYIGDPRLYFRAVAHNLIKEDLKRIKTYVSLEDIDLLPHHEKTENEDETLQIEECLQSCLQKLSIEKRDMIIGYYAKEKQAKIDYRSELAHRFGISVETLRVRVHRIRISLEECIDGCLKAVGQHK